jgi:glycosyltransferase involved in cell wall biosynthesis
MVKYSVIIPTLWKSDRTNKLISDLRECMYVDEIIVIDNAAPTGMNLFVEPKIF